MLVGDVMTREVIGIQADASIAQAIELMLRSHVSGLPVFDDDRHLVGILSEGDMISRTELGTEKKRPRWIEYLIGPGKLAESFVHTHGRKVDEVMTTDVVTISETADLAEAVSLMTRHHIKRLPVTFTGQVVGIVTRADLLKALVKALPTTAAASEDDRIRAAIVAQLEAQEWAPLNWVSVDVADGVVSFRGNISDERQRQALRVVAENVPGIKTIHDHLAWIEPMSGVYCMSPEDKAAGEKEGTATAT